MEKIIGLTLDRTQSLLEDDVHHDTENKKDKILNINHKVQVNLVQVLPFQRHISEINLHLKVKCTEIIGEKNHLPAASSCRAATASASTSPT